MIESFLQAMSRTANSVCVVTTDGIGGKAGVTVSAMTSVSAEGPNPSLLICVHGRSRTCEAIQINRRFCANLLSESQAAISESFAGRTGKTGEDKFDCAEWTTGATGCPVLVGHLAAFDCRLVHSIKVGSHHIFVGEVLDVDVAASGRPLIHHARAYAAARPLEGTGGKGDD